MAEVPEAIETLITEVRKTIRDNKQFLEKLLDEATEVDSGDDSEAVTGKEDFEEL